MIKKYRERVIMILAIVLAAVVLTLTFIYASTPRLPKWEKEKIEEVYYDTWCGGPEHSKFYPLTWYDENGCVEEDLIWRYIGTYGDCYAFLRIGDNLADIDVVPPYTMPNPFPLKGLSREVWYHTEALVVLYHTKKDFPVVIGDREYSGRLASLWGMDNREEWLTDAQLEQLTRDIEKIAKTHN